MRKIESLKRYAFLLPMLVLLLILPLALCGFSSSMGDRVSAESLQVLRTALSRAAVECYALEGFYPPNAQYLMEQYGIVVDEELYFVDYAYMGANLKPDIVVLPAMRGIYDYE